jgi:hypothetical protein
MNLAVERMFQNNDWIAVVLLLVFVLISILKVLYPKRFLALLGCLFSKKYFLDYSSELSEIFSLFNGVLFLIQNITLSLFVCVFSNVFIPEIESVGFQFYLSVFFGVTIYFVFQYLVGKIMALLFRFNEVFEWNRALRFGYLKSLILLVLPVLIFLIYAFPESEVMFWILVVVLLLLLLIRLILILVSNIKQFSYNWFYFILYICTLEILPLMLLYLLVVK